MDMKTFSEKIQSFYNGVPPAILKADEPTGEPPMELFITDEHTEYFLTLKTGSESNHGLLTGILSLTSLSGFILALLFAFIGKWESAGLLVLYGTPLALIPFLWESRRKIPLPIIFNRRTREVYFDHNGKLFHTPWDNIQALAYEFEVFSPYVGSMSNASLEILIRRLGEPETALMLSLGAPMGKNLEMQKGFWEYLRAYMNNGPWFDENGNHSESDTFIRSHLSIDTRGSSFLANTRQDLAQKKAAAEGKNYLSGTDAFLLISTFVFHPAYVVQDLTYNIAKRRSRNCWPEIVLERLRPDGPTTRLIDLERERGLEV
ncbi:hypothetical protein [Pseudomonas batumici]|uniref:Uncharacterized protein n=1 Tax=Pseudomonas batumici TaxID=226910 RepID=A0A0C2F1M1_9PSED|nr:hypothetical protein [Pseudomonas batumici]KIH84850.1 hypothetical protein UCMB321_1178 [Pseudomonas batumici]KIH84938.1 hypothetical protein UCMB321_1266 [Pseudomonas batumici]